MGFLIPLHFISLDNYKKAFEEPSQQLRVYYFNLTFYQRS